MSKSVFALCDTEVELSRSSIVLKLQVFPTTIFRYCFPTNPELEISRTNRTLKPLRVQAQAREWEER